MSYKYRNDSSSCGPDTGDYEDGGSNSLSNASMNEGAPNLSVREMIKLYNSVAKERVTSESDKQCHSSASQNSLKSSNSSKLSKNHSVNLQKQPNTSSVRQFVANMNEKEKLSKFDSDGHCVYNKPAGRLTITNLKQKSSVQFNQQRSSDDLSGKTTPNKSFKANITTNMTTLSDHFKSLDDQANANLFVGSSGGSPKDSNNLNGSNDLNGSLPLQATYPSRTTISRSDYGVRITIDIFFNDDNQPNFETEDVASRIETELPQSHILADFQQHTNNMARKPNN